MPYQFLVKMSHFSLTHLKKLVTNTKLLIDSGFKVCMTTSPHLLNSNERFRFQGKQISDTELKENFAEIFKLCHIDPYIKSDKNWLVKPTFFEFSIGLAFFWFQKKNQTIFY